MESEAFEDMQKGGGALRTIKDLAAGAAGGMAQVLLGMCSWISVISSQLLTLTQANPSVRQHCTHT